MLKKYDREKGVEWFNEVYAGDVQLPPGDGGPFIDFMLETLFGTVWADETLSLRDRRLLLIGAITALGDATTLEIQIRAALKRGELRADQLDALSIFLTQYVGYPRGSQLFRIVSTIRANPGA
ncbi:carboxymuconolactone decarboxylase family protein [Solimonas terrae]|uniref:Carboxymuconolactone decarboxylase family protein n=1 Tax=Solimonas terrae TaxID=1396819 RepID=A0A6M2BRI3_9GAMM|nr:carboxymuconolactone decarboxylase family protein [Solimonas terrae]NGY04855.1 carboxymuconolactone decarboxylase family protein [Solimonas terrae]